MAIGSIRRVSGSWRRYLSSLAALRLSIEQNLRDYAFDNQRDGRIVYLFDASVVQLFLNPAKQARHVMLFGSAPGQGDYVPTALLTADFLFSRSLSGQRGAPAYLSEAHAEDVANIVTRISANIELQRESINRAVSEDESSERLAELVRRVKEVDSGEAIETAMRLLPSLTEDILYGSAYEANQFHRLLDEDLLRPLRLLPEANAGVLEPDVRLVSIWERRITEQRLGNRPAQRGERLKIRRDAITLAQLIVLNDQARDVASEVRYVLVTTDGSIGRAYDRWFQAVRERGHERPHGHSIDDYALRHPRQYVPILNVQQMDNGVDGSDLVLQVRDAIDGLFGVIDDETTEYFSALASIVEDGPNGGDWAEISEFDRRVLRLTKQRGTVGHLLDGLLGRWAQANQGAAVLNAEALKRHRLLGSEALNAILSHHGGFRAGVLTYLDGLLNNVEASHARFVAEGMVRALREARPADPAWDQKLHLRLADTGETERPHRGEVAAREAAERDPRRQWKIGRAALVYAARIALRSRQWNTSVRFSRRACDLALFELERFPKSQTTLYELHEIYYLHAAAARHRPTEAENQRRARAQLNASLSYYTATADRFGLARTLVELGAVGLDAIYYAKLERKDEIGFPVDPDRSFLESIDFLGQARKLTTSSSAGPDRHWQDLASDLYRRLFHAFVYDRALLNLNYVGESDLVAWADELSRIGPPISATLSPLMHEAAKWLSAEGSDERVMAGTLLRSVDLLKGRLDEMDRAVVDRLARWVTPR